MARPRAHIRADVQLAAALIPIIGIPHEHAKQMTAAQIISLAHLDHYPIPHANKGPDEPWNLVWRGIVEHREKTRGDVRAMRKADRIRKRHQPAGPKPVRYRYLNPVGQVIESQIGPAEMRKRYPLLVPLVKRTRAERDADPLGRYSRMRIRDLLEPPEADEKWFKRAKVRWPKRKFPTRKTRKENTRGRKPKGSRRQ